MYTQATQTMYLIAKNLVPTNLQQASQNQLRDGVLVSAVKMGRGNDPSLLEGQSVLKAG